MCVASFHLYLLAFLLLRICILLLKLVCSTPYLLCEHGRCGGGDGHPLLVGPGLLGHTDVQLVVGSS